MCGGVQGCTGVCEDVRGCAGVCGGGAGASEFAGEGCGILVIVFCFCLVFYNFHSRRIECDRVEIENEMSRIA